VRRYINVLGSEKAGCSGDGCSAERSADWVPHQALHPSPAENGLPEV